MKLIRVSTLVCGLALSASAFAQMNPIVGGKEMFPSKNIIEPSTRLTTRRSSQP